MDLPKTKIYLDKLNREFARLSRDPENILRIDVDIMASYVRELYDAVLSVEEAAPKHEQHHAPRKHTQARPAEPEPAFVPPSAPPPPPPPPRPPVMVEIPPAPPPPPVYEEPSTPPPPVYEEPSSPPPMPAPARAPKSTHSEVEILFEEKQAKELSEILAEQPIADLKKGIALNDRLLYTRELFAGDGKAFESTIASLNSFSNFGEAKNYLIEHCVTRYLWLDKKRVDEAKKFIKLVRRRYK